MALENNRIRLGSHRGQTVNIHFESEYLRSDPDPVCAGGTFLLGCPSMDADRLILDFALVMVLLLIAPLLSLRCACRTLPGSSWPA
jgi:hypothetical protein